MPSPSAVPTTLRRPQKRRRCLAKLPSFDERLHACVDGVTGFGLPMPVPWNTTAWRRLINRRRRPINTKARAARLVRRSIRFLESQGYLAARAKIPGFEILAVGQRGGELVYVTPFIPPTGWPPEGCLSMIREFPVPPGCRLVIHRWRNFARQPDVREI
jgi:hypothetical protein